VFLGYLFAILAMLSIGALGILSKLADRQGCPPLLTTLILFGGSAGLMVLYVLLIQKATLRPPAVVVGVALLFGALAVLAFWVFLYGLQFGKITTSWIFMNLSAVVPATLSTVIYQEEISLAKAFALGFVVVSILLLWKDKQKESGLKERNEPQAHAAKSNVKVWMAAMLSAFVLNGVCPFGLRILAGWGLARQYTAVYLFYWYLAGSAFGLIWLVRGSKQMSRAAGWLTGLAMALTSVCGQLFMGLAMAYGVSGSVVYMLGMGASMCVVVFGGLVFFHERVGNVGKLGIVVGLLAAVLLGVTA
jgi:drug/metabolite transporter (DMT)-like permease